MAQRAESQAPESTKCRNVWFIVVGVLDILTALTLAAIYFKVRGLTTSLEKVETVPTYANAIMLMCTGILTIVLFIKTDTILLWPTGSMCVACLLFYATCAMLSGIQTSNTVSKIQMCEYNPQVLRCHCFLTVDRIGEKPLMGSSLQTLVYEGAPSCDAIRHDLLDCMYILCGLYTGGAILALSGFILVLFVSNRLRKEQMRTAGDYIELLRSSSFASQHSTNSQNLDTARRSSRNMTRPENQQSVINSEPAQPTATPSIQTVPKRQRRRRAKFLRQITLPGMGFCLLNQQLRLPGEEHLQLLSIHRTNSLDRAPTAETTQTNQPSTSHVCSRTGSLPNVHRTADIPPGVHVPRTSRQPPCIQNNRVQRSISLEQGRSTITGFRHMTQNRNARPAELTRSHSDTSHQTQGQRAVNIFRIGRNVARHRNTGSPSRPSPAHRTQSDRTRTQGHDHCRHCREYRRWRRLCREYRTCLPNNQMYPLPQHLMIMNYLMSAEGRGRGLAAAFEDPSTLFEPPPPYQDDGPPPYSPGPHLRRNNSQTVQRL